MLGFLASSARASAAELASVRSGASSVAGNGRVVGLAKEKSVNVAGSNLRRFGARLSTKYAMETSRMSYMGSRKYCTVLVDEDMGEELHTNYTDEDLWENTIDANGFLILGEKEVQVDVPHWEKMTEAAFNQMRFSDAVSAYEHIKGIGPNAAFMSDLHIRALDYLGGRDDDIIEAYREMRQRDVKILSESYAKVLKALFRRGEKKRVVSIFELMQSEGTPGTPEVYAVLLALYYKENPTDIETALGILETMKSNGVQPNLDVIDRCLLFFSEANRPDLIKDIYKQYIETEIVKPKRITNSIMAETMLLEGRHEVARSFINRIYQARAYPRLRTYELMILGFLEKGNKKKADEALAEMKHSAKYKATLSVYKAFFKFFESTSDYTGLQETLARMVNEGVPPDSDILESMMMVYFENNKNEEFLATFMQMLDRQMIPARHLWTHRLYVLQQDPFTTMITLLKEYEYMLQAGIEPNEEELRLIVNSMHQADRPDLVEQFGSQDLAKNGIKLAASDYGLLIRSYHASGATALAIQAYEKFLTADIKDAEPHVIMLQSYLEGHNVDEAVQIFETIKQAVSSGEFPLFDTHAPRIMSAFAEALATDAHPFVQQTYDLATEHARDTVDVDLFDTLINYLSGTEQLESALAYYRTMQSTFKLGPTRGIYLSLMECIARVTEAESSPKHISTMFELFRTLVSDPAMHPLNAKLVSTFLLYFVRHANHAGFSQALAFFRHLGNDLADVTLDQVEGAAIRKWLTSSKAEDYVPTEYIARNYALLADNLPNSRELDWEMRDEL